MSSQELMDRYNQLGKEASALLNRAKIGAIITVILVIISANAVHLALGILVFLIGGIVVLPAAYKMLSIIKERQQLYKENYVAFVLGEMLDNVQYMPENGFSKNAFQKMYLAQLPKRQFTDDERQIEERNKEYLRGGVNDYAFHSEDYIRASYKNVWFDYADVISKTSHEYENRTVTESIFEGSAIKFEINMKSVQDLHIFSKRFHHRAELKYASDLIDLEDIEFNEEFDVYSAIEEEAFYMLTPQFMERIKKLHRKYPTLSMRFADNAFYVGFYTDGYTFDVSSGDLEADKKRIADHVQVIKDIVDILQLA